MNEMNKTVKKWKTAGRITVLILLALIIGVNVYTLNASRLVGNPLPMPFGFGTAVVLSGSMEPELSVGDLLVVVARESYAVNDVVVYQDGRTAVTHRIVSMTGDEVVTQGDANNTADDPITIAQIKGEVVAALPLVGYVVSAVKTPLGTLCVAILALWLLERSFRAEKQKKQQELDAIKAQIAELRQKGM